MSRRPGQVSGLYHHGLERTSTNASVVNRNVGHEYPFANLVPAQAGEASRRHSMTVQHMLNPSDEEPRLHSQSRSPQSSDNASGRRSPGPYRYGNISMSGQHSHGSHASRKPTRGRAQANHRANRRTGRRASLSSSASEADDNERRAFRPKYTDEEAHFIWYLRIDRGYLWPDIRDAYNDRFPYRRGIGGLQCRYYRLIDQNHLDQVRDMTRTAHTVQRYGMRANLARQGIHVDYPWLDGEYPANDYGQVLHEK